MQEIKTYTTKEEKELLAKDLKELILKYQPISTDWKAYIREDPHRTYRGNSRCRQAGGLNYIVVKFTKLEFEGQIEDRELLAKRITKHITDYNLPITVSGGESELLGGFNYIAIMFTEPQWKEYKN